MPPIRVVLIGDSVTAGQHVDPPWRWTDIVTDRIARAFPEVSVEVRGVSGDTTRLGLERFPRDVQALQPDVLVIQFGLNDCNRWDSDRGMQRVSPHAYVANLVEMIARGRHFGAKQVILTTNHPTLRPTLEASDARPLYNDAVRFIAEANRTMLCDIAESFECRVPLTEMLLPDGVHLNPQGHFRYASIMYPAIADAVRRVVGS